MIRLRLLTSLCVFVSACGGGGADDGTTNGSPAAGEGGGGTSSAGGSVSSGGVGGSGVSTLGGGGKVGSGGAAGSTGAGGASAGAGGTSDAGGGGMAGVGGGTEGGAGGALATPAVSFASNGTRLRNRYFQVGDTRVVTNLFDTQLGFDCRPEVLADGAEVCAPTFQLHDTGAFADAACTTPTVYAPAECEGTFSYALVQTSGCGGASSVHSLGPTVPTPYTKQGTSCVALPIPPGVIVRALGDEIPSSALVAVTTTTAVDWAPSLKAMTKTFADGAQLFATGFFDVGRDATCVPASGQKVCAPVLAGIFSPMLGEFADSACTIPVVSTKSTCGDDIPTATVTYQTGADGCPKANYYSFGSTPDKVFELSGTTCFDSMIPPADLPQSGLVVLGAPIPIESLPALALSDMGTGPVVARTLIAAGGSPIEFEYFAVAATGSLCVIEQISPGTYVCVDDVEPALVFSDAGCTNPLYELPVNHPGTCGGDAKKASYLAVPISCGETSIRRIAAAPVSPTTVYELQGSSCVVTNLGTGTYFAADEVVDAKAMFPAASVGVE